MEWWFWGWLPKLEGDNDESRLPIEWHPSIVKGMVNQAKVDDKEMSPADALILWQNEVRKLKQLEVTKAIIEQGGQYGTIDTVFPEISSGSPESYFRIAGRGDVEGVIW